MNPGIGDEKASRILDRGSQRDRPAVLDQRDGSGRALGDLVGDVPHLILDHAAVEGGLGAGDRTGLGSLLTRDAEPDQRTDGGAELDRLVLVEVTVLDHGDHAVLVLADDAHVDQTDHVALAQIGEHLGDLALELTADESDDQQLHRSDGHPCLLSWSWPGTTSRAASLLPAGTPPG